MTRFAFHPEPRRRAAANPELGPSLFDAPSKAGSLPTSRKAGRQVKPRAVSIALRGLQAVAGVVSGLTPDEAADRVGEDHLAMRPRFSTMHRKHGWLTPRLDSEGAFLERPSTHGGKQVVMTITALGREELLRHGLDPLSRLLRAG